MADWFDSIEIFDEIAFDDGPLETPTTWYDITDSVLEFRSFTGKTSLDTEFAPGYGSLVLDNSSGDFTPENPDGTYYGSVKPMRRYRRTVTVGMTTYTVFTGYVLSWDQDWRQQTSYVTVPLVDATRFVENTPLSTSAYAYEVLADSPLAYYPLQTGDQAVDVAGGRDALIVATSDESLESGAGSIPIGEPGWVRSDSNSMRLLRSFGDVAPKSIEFWTDSASSSTTIELVSSDDLDVIGVHIFPTSIGGPNVYYLNDSDGKSASGGGGGQDWYYDSFGSGFRHHVVAMTSTQMKVYIDGALIKTANLSSSTSNPLSTAPVGYLRVLFGANKLSHLAFYESTLSASRIAAHYEAGRSAWGNGHNEFGGTRIERALDDAGFPSGSRDIDAGQTIHGPYLPAEQGLLDYLRQVERAEQGILYFGADGSVTFRDRQTLSAGAGSVIFSDDDTDITGGAIEYVSGNPRGNPIDQIRNIATASYNQTGAITRRDATSVTDYGEARQVIDSPTLPDGRAASNLAKFVVRERKDPKSVYPALTIQMRPNTEDKMHELFGLELGSVVTVRRTPFDLVNEIETTAVVLGMSHENVGRDGQWTLVLYLAPALTQYNDADTPLLRVGSGDDTNKIGATAGNIITY